MDRIFLVSLAVCLSVQALLSILLVYVDIQRRQSNGMTETSNHSYFWERHIAALFGLVQLGLSTAGIIAIIPALRSESEVCWLDMIVLCNLQLLVGTNLARILRVLLFPPWTIWATYIFTVLTAPDIIHSISSERTSFLYDSTLLSRLAIVSFLSSAVSRTRMKSHLDSGARQNRSRFKRLLTLLIIPNAAATVCQLSGAIVFYTIAHAEWRMNIYLRQYIFLAYTSLQILCPLALCLSVIRRLINGIRGTLMWRSQSTRTRNNNMGRVIELTSSSTLNASTSHHIV